MAEQEQQQQARSAYQKVVEKVELARGKLEEIGEKVKEFDAREQTAAGKEKATAYLKATMERTQEALADLTKQAQALKDNATEIPVRAFSNAFARVNDSLTDLKDKARAFDEQHQLSSKLTEVVQHPRDQATIAIATASSYVAEAAHSAYAQLQGVSDGIKFRVMSAADQGVTKGVSLAVTADEKLHITQRAEAVGQKVKEFNETYHVSDKLEDLDKRWSLTGYLTSLLSSVVQLDQKVTGGRVEPAVSSAYELGLQMAGYVREKYEKAAAEAKPEAVPITTAAPEEPTKPAEEPQKPVEEPQKPAEEPQKPAEEPKKPAKEPKKPAEAPKKASQGPKEPAKAPEAPAAVPVATA